MFTAAAQEYFAGRGFVEEPKRCKKCYLELKRAKRRSEREALGCEGRNDIDGDDLDGGVGVLVWRWPPDGYPPRHLFSHCIPPINTDNETPQAGA